MFMLPYLRRQRLRINACVAWFNLLTNGRFRSRRRAGSVFAVLLAVLLGGGFVAVSQAQGQKCRDIKNMTVCADELISLGADDFTLNGNIKIGRRGAAPLLHVRNANNKTASLTFSAFYLDKYGTSGVIETGTIHIIGDPNPTPIAQSVILPNPDGFLADSWLVDPDKLLVFNPAEGKHDPFEIGFERNQNLRFDFLQRAGFSPDFDLSSSLQFTKIDVVFDMSAGKEGMQATIPLNVGINNGSQTSNVQFTTRVTINAAGELSQASDTFSVPIGGLVGQASGVTISGGAGPNGQTNGGSVFQADAKGVNFSAEVFAFRRADNPDLPNLDPSKPDLVFSIQGVDYKDGHFTIRGGAASLPDWQVGRAFKLTNQQISIETNPERTASTLIISSTLGFPSDAAVTDNRTFPMAIRISGKELPSGKITPAITGTLLGTARPALAIGPLTITPPAKTELVFSPEQNFFGLKADQVTLKWNNALGGGSGVQSGFKLGVDKNKQLVFGLGAGGGITLPSIKTNAVTLQLSGNLENTADLTTFKITGGAKIGLPGNGSAAPSVTMAINSGKNVRDTCAPNVPCTRRFTWQLSSFELKLAGFGIGITGAQGTADGGFLVAKATLKAPVGVKSFGGSISGLTISRTGNVSLTGGSVELPPLQVGSFSLAGVKGNFVKTTTGYEFRGAGTVPLPGLEPNSTKKITGEVVIRTKSDGNFNGFGVVIEFNTASPGIPIANTGMELTMLRGSFDVNSGTVKVSAGMRASSQLRFGPLPAVTAEGNAALQFQPFQLTANAKLSVLVIQVAQASVGIGHQQGFNNGPGFNVNFDVNFVLARGETKLRIGPVTLSNGQRKTVIAAEAIYTVGIKRSAIFPLMPPANINVAQLAFRGGTFTVKGRSETLGLLGRVKVRIPFLPDPSLSVFVDLRDRRVDVTDTDDYKLINATVLRANAAAGLAGYQTNMLAPSEAQVLGLDPNQPLLQEALPITLDRNGTALFGISYPPGSAPNLRLQLPDGRILNEQSVAEGSISFLRYTDSTSEEPHELAFVLADAQAGNYSLIIDAAPGTYDTVTYMINEEPVVADVAVQCGGAPVSGVTVECAGAPSGATATVNWTMQDADSPTATMSVGYAPFLFGTDGGEADLSQFTLLAEGLAQGPGSFTWELSDVPTGVYALVVRAEDGQNVPVETVSATPISVTDQRAPAAPTGLRAESLPGELLVRWNPGLERDLAGYMIGFGIVQAGVADDPANFIYSRDMGAKETSLESGDLFDAKLWGLTDGQEVFVGLRAYDQSGNQSAWSLLRAQPWELAPKAWTPIPDGQLVIGNPIEIAFATPLDLPPSETLPAGLLELRDAAGAQVAGRLEPISDPSSAEIVGLRFVPTQPLTAGERYTALLQGGAAGLRSQAGAQMAADYRWNFQTVQRGIYLPLLGR